MSQTERSVHADIKTMLVNNEPHQYGHLIKFERPSLPDEAKGGRVSTSAERYTYLTDASHNIDFDDGSTDLDGNSNGTQTYIANKVLSVGSIREETKASPSQTSLQLDGTALGAYLEANITITNPSTGVWDLQLNAPTKIEDAIYQGFREGDKLSVSGINVNIHSFRADNKIRVTKIDDDLSTGTSNKILSNTSEEIISILLNKNDADYASFINREVFIYRIYKQDGETVGTPILFFKGIIQNVSFDDSDRGVTVTWGLTSHWGDFAQVKGRITSDDSHRALDENGVPQVVSALKPSYAYDKGFIHAESSVHVLAKYSVLVEDIKVKAKSGFLGLFAKTKVKKTLKPEDRFTDLDFQLGARAIPVIYGVRATEGIPIFADTLNDNSAEVYMAIALSEGEIGGLYDLYIDENSLICVDESDYDARSDSISRTSEADDAITMYCRGRADQGDVLGGTTSTDTGGSLQDFYVSGVGYLGISLPQLYNYISETGFYPYSEPTTAPSSSSGLLDGESLHLDSPQDITIDLFTGKAGQKASSQLIEIAKANNFKIQNDYWTGNDTSEYWGPNHRLLDTAYVVVKYIISEGEETIPELKWLVRGKLLDCYNYDYSFLHDDKTAGEDSDNFVLGDTVDLKYSGGTLHSNVQIIDKWTFKNPDGTDNVRFRFDTTPNLSFDSEGKPSITKFWMDDGVNTWTMITHNHELYNGDCTTLISSISSVADSSGSLRVNFSTNSNLTITGDINDSSPKLRFTNSSAEYLTSGYFVPFGILEGAVTSTSIITTYPYSEYSGLDTYTSYYVASANTIKLATGSATDNYYTGELITVTRIDSTSGKAIIQTAEIIGYDGTTKIATINTIWDFIPKTGDSVIIIPKYADKRVSINPAIQTLDYITSTTYGRGLDPYKELDLPSWTETARKCDTRSDVSLNTSTSIASVAVDDVYKYPSSGNIIWQGTVSSTSTGSHGNYVTFTNVLGKLTNRWNSWKYWDLNEILYYEGNRYLVTTAGVKSTAPVHTTGTTDGLQYISASTTNITKVSGSGPATLALSNTDQNPIFSERNGKKISGYSVYDSDSIKYWKMCGWDEHAQRYVTKFQTNMVINTSQSLFENINGMLEHFGGILRYSSGKYYLDIEELAGTISTSDIRTITTDDIIGKIQLTDEGTRSSFNSLTAAYADPSIKFEARNISFFNSTYLKVDKNLPKKGNLSIPGMTNYYNTRILADSFLNKSRFGLSISMRVRHHGTLLLSGTVIQVIYPRYGSSWESPGKKFRIENINYLPNGEVDIVAREYDDSFYSISNVGGGSLGANVQNGGASQVSTVIDAPTNLIITSSDNSDELFNGIQLFWTNNPKVEGNPNVVTEVYGSLSTKLYLTITDIASNVLTSSVDHDLVVGMPVYINEPTTVNGLNPTTIYYVLDTPTSNTFTLTDTKNSGTEATLSNGSSLTISIRTATLLGEVPVSKRVFVDNVVNDGDNTVEKYYWIRHKIIRNE